MSTCLIFFVGIFNQTILAVCETGEREKDYGSTLNTFIVPLLESTNILLPQRNSIGAGIGKELPWFHGCGSVFSMKICLDVVAHSMKTVETKFVGAHLLQSIPVLARQQTVHLQHSSQSDHLQSKTACSSLKVLFRESEDI